MNRREFVQGSAVLATTMALQSKAQAASAPQRAFKIALTPGSIGVTVASQRELNGLAHRHGFEAVEPMSAEIAGMSPAQLAELAADLGAKHLVWAAAGLPVVVTDHADRAAKMSLDMLVAIQDFNAKFFET